MQQAAKQLDTGPRQLFRWLRNQHVLTIGNLPNRHYTQAGLLKIRYGSYDHPVRGEIETQRPVFTRQGMAWLKARWAESHPSNN